MVSYFGDKEAMAKISAGWSERSNGVTIGAVGTLYSWLVFDVRPSWRVDILKTILSLFSCKVFYALHFQCIIDDQKRVI